MLSVLKSASFLESVFRNRNCVCGLDDSVGVRAIDQSEITASSTQTLHVVSMSHLGSDGVLHQFETRFELPWHHRSMVSIAYRDRWIQSGLLSFGWRETLQWIGETCVEVQKRWDQDQTQSKWTSVCRFRENAT